MTLDKIGPGTKYHAGKLQTVIEDLDLPNPVKALDLLVDAVGFKVA
jgi:hypothetical protein